MGISRMGICGVRPSSTRIHVYIKDDLFIFVCFFCRNLWHEVMIICFGILSFSYHRNGGQILGGFWKSRNRLKVKWWQQYKLWAPYDNWALLGWSPFGRWSASLRPVRSCRSASPWVVVWTTRMYRWFGDWWDDVICEFLLNKMGGIF